MDRAKTKISLQYNLGEQVGQGSLGQVFRAVQKETGRTVAIKLMNDNIQQNEELIGIFQKEMMMLMRLSHPNLVSMVDCNIEPPACFLVTDFIDGWSLREVLKKCGHMPPLVGAAVCWQILGALDHLHLRDLVHADLSDANIMIRRDGRVFVTDMGLASDVVGDRYRYEQVGTAGYYSPEHINRLSIDPRSDLYSVGLLFFEILTSQKAILNVRSGERSAEILSSMKRINSSLISCAIPSMQDVCRRLAGVLLQVKLSSRLESAELGLYAFGRLLSMFSITDVEACIHQFLVDSGLTLETQKPPLSQNIYQGYTPYS